MDLNELNAIAVRLPVKKVDCSKTFPDLDGKLYVRVMTGEEKNAYQISKYRMEEDEDDPDRTKIIPDPENASAKLVIRTLCDETGKRLYSDEDLPTIAKWNSLLLDVITATANEINKLDIEELEKNSKGVPTDDSCSG